MDAPFAVLLRDVVSKSKLGSGLVHAGFSGISTPSAGIQDYLAVIEPDNVCPAIVDTGETVLVSDRGFDSANFTHLCHFTRSNLECPAMQARRNRCQLRLSLDCLTAKPEAHGRQFVRFM
jgi:hypothetical protein